MKNIRVIGNYFEMWLRATEAPLPANGTASRKNGRQAALQRRRHVKRRLMEGHDGLVNFPRFVQSLFAGENVTWTRHTC